MKTRLLKSKISFFSVLVVAMFTLFSQTSCSLFDIEDEPAEDLEPQTTFVTYSVSINGGGGYHTETRLKFKTNGVISAVKGKGSSDAEDHHVRVGISKTNGDFYSLQSTEWINVPSSKFNNGSFYVILNSKWGSDIDTFASFRITIEGTNPELTYVEMDDYDDDLGYVDIRKE